VRLGLVLLQPVGLGRPQRVGEKPARFAEAALFGREPAQPAQRVGCAEAVARPLRQLERQSQRCLGLLASAEHLLRKAQVVEDGALVQGGAGGAEQRQRPLLRVERFVEPPEVLAIDADVVQRLARLERVADGFAECKALPVVVEYSLPLLRMGGAMVAMKGQLSDHECTQASHALGILGGDELEAVRLDPFPGSRDRLAYVAKKIRPTPSVYPRRAGMPLKRPLG